MKRKRNKLPLLAADAGMGEREYLVSLMRQHGSAQKAADAVGVHQSTIYNWLYAKGIINTWIADPIYGEKPEASEIDAEQ